MKSSTRICVLGLVLVAAASPSAFASFHFMQIEQVIGGVNGNASAQAIQLRMRSAGQNIVSAAQVCVEDAAGLNSILIVNMNTNVPNGQAGRRVLIASSGFAANTTPTAVPDFVMTNVIPSSYLAAGSLTFRGDSGSPCTGTVYWRLSWGGAGYTGSNAGSTTNDANGNFGPPFAGPLPSTSAAALLFQNGSSAASTSNNVDYALTAGAATFTNNANNSFTVSTPFGACCDDDLGNCTEAQTQSACESAGNRYGGNGSTCATINPPCVPPGTGACCDDSTGICTEGQTQAQCQSSGSRYGGDDSTCATINPPCVEPPSISIPIELETIATGLPSPLLVTDAKDGTGRLFVCDQSGKIFVISGGQVLATPFLDITSKLPTLGAVYDERGLLGLTFHPDYALNGKFYVRYSHPRTSTGSEPCDLDAFIPGCHEEILAQYTVLGNPLTSNVADPASEVILFRVDKPQWNHNGAHVAFGPDGYLYFSLGDGGGANDGLSDDPPSHGPDGNGQNLQSPLGKMLRIDVDNPQNPLPYGIPSDNPFVDGVDGLPEIYAWGFRNPFRFSFDDGLGGGGLLYLADVGQELFEEVNIVMNAGNYGWVIREGAHCFDAFATTTPPVFCPDDGPLGEHLEDPIVEYLHPIVCTQDSDCAALGVGCDEAAGLCENEGGIAIVGGFVYRGTAYPPLVGKYVFGDFSADFGPSGRLYYFDLTGNDALIRKEFSVTGIESRGPGFSQFVKGFGQDSVGEIYVCASTDLAPAGTGGSIYRIAPPRAPSSGESPRYIQIDPPAAEFEYAILIEPDCPNSTAKYIGAPQGPLNVSMPVDNPANAARLNSTQWGPTVHVTGVDVSPLTGFKVYADYGPPGSPALSASVLATTRRSGDVIQPFTGEQPNISDIAAIIDVFKDVPNSLPVTRVDLVGSGGTICIPQQVVNIADVAAAVDAFKAVPYVCPRPCP